MRGHLVAGLVTETVRGRGVRAWRELSTLGRYRAQIEAARRIGGHIEPAPSAAQRDHLARLEERWYLPAIRRAGLRPGVLALLDHLEGWGVPQVVFSDYVARGKLAALGIGGRFAAHYIGVEMGAVKPDPRGLLRIAADFQIPPASLLHIGDRTDSDGQAARAAGCPCLILGADFASFYDLLGVFAAVGRRS